MKVLLLAFLVATGVAISSPADAVAQTRCTTECECVSDGCGCRSSGGNGSGCSASGDGCFVKKCGTELQSVGMAADGSFVDLRDVMPAVFASDQNDGRRDVNRQPTAADWQFVSKGHAVARDCSGIIIARFYDASTATGIRRASKNLTI